MAKNIRVAEESKSQLTAMWKHIYSNIRDMLHPHHFTHEPGGLDEVKFPLGYVKNVTITDPKVGQVLTISEVGNNGDWWTNGAGRTGQAFFEATGSLNPGTIPGPTNITGSAFEITRVLVQSNDIVSGTVTAGGGFAFGSGGGSLDSTGLSHAWSDGGQINMTISSASTGSAAYLTADVYFEVV